MTSTSLPDDGAQVASVGLWRVALPLLRAHRATHGTEEVRHLVLVEVQLADATVGWGECSALARPTYSSEYTAGAWAMLRDVLVPSALAGVASPVVGHPMATAALVTAITDALLRRVERSLAVELAAVAGGNPHRSMPTTAVIGRTDGIDELLAVVAERVERSVAAVKLKVGPGSESVAAAAAVRATWPDLTLAVDGNGSLDVATARALDELGLAYLEQPLPADALVASAHLATSLDAPIALDESVATPGELDSAVALGAGRVLNVKPARCGGPHAAVTLIARARNAGLDAFVGGMVESGVGRAAALAVAAVPGCTLPTDLGPSAAYVAEDLTEPLIVDDDGRIVTPTGPGIGRNPSPERVRAVALDHIVIDR